MHSLSGEKKVELQSDLQSDLQSGLQSESCQDNTEECKTDELREFCYDPNVKDLCPLSCGQCSNENNGQCKDNTEECKTDELREFCYDPNVKELCPLSCGQCGMQLNNRFIFLLIFPLIRYSSHFVYT